MLTRRLAIPRYDFVCENADCGEIVEDTASMSSFKEHHPACPKCGSVCNYVYTPTVCQVALKDGPTGSWPSKGMRFQQYRNKRHEEVGRKQKERYGHLSSEALPNYNGQETGTWAEAQNQALKDKGVESAATYSGKVNAEKAKT